MSKKLTQEEFEAWFNSPVVQRLWTISQDVHEGRADPETVEAFEDLRDTMLRVLKNVERALSRYEPKAREGVLRGWMEGMTADQPTRH